MEDRKWEQYTSTEGGEAREENQSRELCKVNVLRGLCLSLPEHQSRWLLTEF